jgi:hypothetical protein
MSRKLVLVALGCLVAAAVVASRRRSRVAPVDASGTPPREANGRQAGSNESLRVFVEAGERRREDSQPAT